MPPCHVKPSLRQLTYDATTSAEESVPAPDANAIAQDACDHCGGSALVWRKCKLICTNCNQINKSCADL